MYMYIYIYIYVYVYVLKYLTVGTKISNFSANVCVSFGAEEAGALVSGIEL
jgi:hypothetical protein